MISIDGWRVPGYETKVGCGVKLASADLSGYGSFTLNSDEGVKPSVVSVTTKIPFIDSAELADLITMAKGMDDNGAKIVRTINSDLTQAYKVRKAIFDGDVKAVEDEEVKAWIVTFKLLEKLSTAERTQQQIDGTAAENSQTQAIDGHNSVQQAFENSEGP